MICIILSIKIKIFSILQDLKKFNVSNKLSKISYIYSKVNSLFKIKCKIIFCISDLFSAEITFISPVNTVWTRSTVHTAKGKECNKILLQISFSVALTQFNSVCIASLIEIFAVLKKILEREK